MNALLNYEFTIDESSNEEFDLDYSIEVAKDNIDSYLEKITINYFTNYSYKDNVWYVYNENQDTILTIDFLKYKEYKNEKMLDVLKCWVSTLLLEYSGGTVQSHFRYLVRILNMTDTFNISNLGDLEDYLLTEITEQVKYSTIISIFNFLDFYDELDTTDEYIGLISELHKKFESKTRAIPSSRDCLKFLFVLNDFFSSNPKDDWRYLYFSPIRIWWILTTKIPMRIGEFLKIKRNDLKIESNRYYLKLPRAKQRNNKKRIQVIDRIEIDERFYNIINNYVVESDKFGESETLISFKAYRKMRDKLVGLSSNKKRNDRRINQDAFSNMLYDFYETIIKNPPYNFTLRDIGKDDIETISKSRKNGIIFDIERRLRPNDTRHLAFMFLKLQGLHPVEIARLGGHLSLKAQTHYFKHREFETDSSTFQLLRLFDIEGQYFKSKFFETIKAPSTSSKIDDEFRRRFILKNQEPDQEKWDKLDIGWCTATTKRCKPYCFVCKEYWKIEYEEFKEKYNEIVMWMNSVENDALKVYNALGQIHEQILSNKLEQIDLNLRIKQVLNTKSKELKDLLESIGVCVDHIYEQTGVNLSWQTSIQKTKSMSYLTDM
ncbi:hypothetical protein [Bacillus kwashiorkori]|uniref:hypothetical protein n=1 Tax=Bacillus kwashiorkori TaxID=1522318 RepID=UPI00078524DB|nr:hypothetical protein [Bacillus kwashiorkori]